MANEHAESSDHIIVRPEDLKLVARLGLKLQEYTNRLETMEMDPGNRYKSPEHPIFWATLYKIALLKAVLEEGSVDTHEMSMTFYEKGMINIKIFNGAAGAIHDYCLTGGKNVSDGTGLPELENPADSPPNGSTPADSPTPHSD